MIISFNERCYELLKQIPKGRVTTYGYIAQKLECKAYQAVGNAMASNKNIPDVPCHRVVKSTGEIGSYQLGTERKIEILKSEGVEVKNGYIVNFEEKLYRF